MVDTLLFFLSKNSSKSLWRIHFFFVLLSPKSKHLQFKTNQKMNYHKIMAISKYAGDLYSVH